MLKFGLGFSAIIFKVGEVVDIRDTCWTRVIDTTQNDQQKRERERERERKMKKHLAILPFLSSVHCCHSDMVVFRSWTTKGKKTLAHAAINNERAFCVNVKNSTDPPFFSYIFFSFFFFLFLLFWLYIDIFSIIISPFFANGGMLKVKVASMLPNVNKFVENSL